jgi:hypothetical protein
MTPQQLEVYNTVISLYNPITKLEVDEVYSEYTTIFQDTIVFERMSYLLTANKTFDKTLTQDEYIGNYYILLFAAMFELFCEDDIVETFYIIFKEYIEFVFLGSDSPVCVDVNGNNFIHYILSCLNYSDHVLDLYILVQEGNKNILPMKRIKNNANVSIFDMIG